MRKEVTLHQAQTQRRQTQMISIKHNSRQTSVLCTSELKLIRILFYPFFVCFPSHLFWMDTTEFAVQLSEKCAHTSAILKGEIDAIAFDFESRQSVFGIFKFSSSLQTRQHKNPPGRPFHPIISLLSKGSVWNSITHSVSHTLCKWTMNLIKINREKSELESVMMLISSCWPLSHFRQPFDLTRHPEHFLTHPRWTLAWNNLTENVSMFDLGNWKPFGLSSSFHEIYLHRYHRSENFCARALHSLIDFTSHWCWYRWYSVPLSEENHHNFSDILSSLFFFIASHSSPFAHVSGRERDRWRLQITSLMPSWFKQQHTWLSDDMAEHTHHDRMRNALRNFHVFLLLNTQNSKSMQEKQKTAAEEKKFKFRIASKFEFKIMTIRIS